MRTNRIGAFVASTALASATILGGAGIASADSLGSLGSSEGTVDPAVVLTLDEANVEGASGTLSAQGVDEALQDCFIGVSSADGVSELEAAYADGEVTALGFGDLNTFAPIQDANAEGQNAISSSDVPEGDVAEWESTAPKTDEDYRAGAWVTCDYDGDALVAFAYEPAGFIGSVEGVIGSIDFGGSLGSITGS